MGGAGGDIGGADILGPAAGGRRMNRGGCGGGGWGAPQYGSTGSLGGDGEPQYGSPGCGGAGSTRRVLQNSSWSRTWPWPGRCGGMDMSPVSSTNRLIR